MTTVSFNIPGINCGHCEHTIKTEVGEMDGVVSVEPSAATKTAIVTFDAPATEEAIKSLLIEINFPAED